MLVYAHRAGRGLAPENTLDACHRALQFPIDFIDFDIGMTKDGHLVVTHDLMLNVDITRDKFGNFVVESLPVYEMTYAELEQYNVGSINHTSIYAAFFPDQQPMHQAKIPLLKEAIELVQNLSLGRVGFQIEIKMDPENPHLTASPEMYAESLYKLLREMDIVEKTEVQSFDFRPLLCLQQLDVKLKTAYLTLPAEDPPLASKWMEGYDSLPKMVKALGGKCWGPFQMDLTERDIAEAKSLGLKVVPWGYPEKEGTEFNASQILKLIEWGVDGIITDRPDRLLQVLRKKQV